MTLDAKAQLFRRLHGNPPLMLANAWDAASAVLVVDAGATAVATTSAGVSWSSGRRDGQQLSRAEMIAAVRRIAEAVDVPVSADLEGGYGESPEDVAATVRDAVAAGVVGVNLEDSREGTGELFDVADQSARIRAARQAAADAGLPGLYVNARTDVFLLQVGDPAGRLEEVVRRAAALAEAGADGVFVPGLLDLDQLRELAARCPLPLNAMSGPGAPSAAELAAVGVQRISVGTALAQAAYTLARTAAAELLVKGTVTTLEGALDPGRIDALFPAR